MQIRITPAVKFLLIACFVLFIVQQTVDRFFGGSILTTLGLVPYDVVLRFKLWQIFSYSFLHAEVFHLFFNLMMLVIFGCELEAIWKSARFLRYYFFCTSSAAAIYLIIQVLVKSNETLYVPMVGASGGIFGLLVAYGIIFGERVILFMLLFPMKAKHFIWIIAAFEFMTTVFSGSNGLAGVAHLGGMAGGFGLLWLKAAFIVIKRRREQRQGVDRSKKRNLKDVKHLKLVIDNDKDTSKDDSDSTGGGSPTTWH